jgi:hypothetical protein
MDKRFYCYVDYALILLGLFLIIDSFFVHWIIFNYSTIGLAWLDPHFNHWMIGVFLVLVAWWDLRKHK